MLAGFFSKDEILYETFAEGHTHPLGRSGALTSLLTATYMFRLVFLTFFGSGGMTRRAPNRRTSTTPHRTASRDIAPAAADSHGHGASSHLHDAPPAMALALIVLAIGSVAGRLHRRAARARRTQRAGRLAGAGVWRA